VINARRREKVQHCVDKTSSFVFPSTPAEPNVMCPRSRKVLREIAKSLHWKRPSTFVRQTIPSVSAVGRFRASLRWKCKFVSVLNRQPMLPNGDLSNRKMTLRSERIAWIPEEDWRKCSPNFQEPLFHAIYASSKRCEASARATKRQRARWPFAWTLRNPAVTGVIVGIHSAQQVSSIAGARDIKLSPQDGRQIEQGMTRLAA
jgi:hypothetical protein